MSAAKLRLLASWHRLTEHCVAAAVSACEASHPPPAPDPDPGTPHPVRGKKAPGPPSYEVGIASGCAPAATAQVGQVRVAVTAQQYDRHINDPVAELVPLTNVVAVAATPTNAPPTIAAGTDFVLVEIVSPAQRPLGMYIGRVTDATGAIDAPFVIFLDGLP